MTFETFAIGIVGYIVGMGFVAMCAGEQMDGEEWVLWPLFLLKWLVKALYKVAFTGWRS